MKYWNQKGQYQNEYEKLWESLVPISGHSDTLGGEVLRAATRIYHDGFNNGFCNNTTGAWNYLMEYLVSGTSLDEARRKLVQSLNNIHECMNVCYEDAEYYGVELDNIMDCAIEFNLNNEESKNREHSVKDMFDYQEKTVYPEDDWDEDEEEDTW